MRLGIDVAQHQLSWDELVERVRWAEAAGFDGAWVFDHFKALYGEPGGPCMEGWSLLAALAAATERIRLGALVTGVTYRPPSILAAQAVTVDHVSHGRLELGMGAAWFEQEHIELGIDFPATGERVRRLEEAIEVMKALMTGDGVSFRGRYYRLNDASYNPKPVQRPHPPLWIGASGERLMLPLAARHADVWHSYAGGSREGLRRKWAIVAEHAERAGRDPGSIRRATNLSISEDLDEVARRAEQLREDAIDYAIVSWPGQGAARVEAFMERIGNELQTP